MIPPKNLLLDTLGHITRIFNIYLFTLCYGRIEIYYVRNIDTWPGGCYSIESFKKFEEDVVSGFSTVGMMCEV